MAKIRAAKAALEAAAATGEAATDGAGTPPNKAPNADASKDKAAQAQAPKAPKAKTQRNFTDPDSRIMKTKDACLASSADHRGRREAARIQGYNAQAAVAGAAQIIVAHGLTNHGSDQGQLTPLLDAVRANTGRAPKEVSADAGYASAANLEAIEARGVRAYVATGRQRHGEAAATGRGRQHGPRMQAMRTRLKRGGFKSRYRLRKQTVEPVFGQIKQARGFRQFLLRSLAKVEPEWALVCTAHNLAKLATAAN